MRIPIYQQIEQAKRQEKYPKDRIAFLNTESAVWSDKETFNKYQRGDISLRQACERIAESNFLQEVTEEQFLNECKLLGYARHIKR